MLKPANESLPEHIMLHASNQSRNPSEHLKPNEELDVDVWLDNWMFQSGAVNLCHIFGCRKIVRTNFQCRKAMARQFSPYL